MHELKTAGPGCPSCEALQRELNFCTIENSSHKPLGVSLGADPEGGR